MVLSLHDGVAPWASSGWLVSLGPGRCWLPCQALYIGPSACRSAGCSDVGSSCATPAASSRSPLPRQTMLLCSYRGKNRRGASGQQNTEPKSNRDDAQVTIKDKRVSMGDVSWIPTYDFLLRIHC